MYTTPLPSSAPADPCKWLKQEHFVWTRPSTGKKRQVETAVQTDQEYLNMLDMILDTGDELFLRGEAVNCADIIEEIMRQTVDAWRNWAQVFGIPDDASPLDVEYKHDAHGDPNMVLHDEESTVGEQTEAWSEGDKKVGNTDHGDGSSTLADSREQDRPRGRRGHEEGGKPLSRAWLTKAITGWVRGLGVQGCLDT